jgi:hypothetical protein
MAVHGSNARIYVNGLDLSPDVDQATTSDEVELPERTAFGDHWKRYVAGAISDGTVSLEAFFEWAALPADDALTARAVLEAAMGQADGLWTFLPAGDGRGMPAVCVGANGSSFETNAELGELVRLTAEAQASDGLAYSVVLHELAQETSDGSGQGVDNGAATSNGAVACLHVSETDGAATITVEHSVDGSVWVELATFALADGYRGGQRQSVTGTVNRHLRATHDVDTSATYHLAVGRQ